MDILKERNTGFRRDEMVGRTPEEVGVYFNLAGLERMEQARETQVPFRNQETQYRTKRVTCVSRFCQPRRLSSAASHAC